MNVAIDPTDHMESLLQQEPYLHEDYFGISGCWQQPCLHKEHKNVTNDVQSPMQPQKSHPHKESTCTTDNVKVEST